VHLPHLLLFLIALAAAAPARAQVVPCALGERGCCKTALACDDGNACNGRESCDTTGTCVVGEPVMCGDPGPCGIPACLPPEGICVYIPINAGDPCDDGDACTEADACDDGLCRGRPRGCEDGNPCTSDTCEPQVGCVNLSLPDGSQCSDRDPCTRGDECTAGLCLGRERACNDRDPCTIDACDPVGGGCLNSPAPDGSPCNDRDPCTEPDQCRDGVCGGTPRSCDDGNSCTLDGCTAGTGCTHAGLPDGSDCDDRDPCTRLDACAGGVCTGRERACNDRNPCTDDACDSLTGACVNTPVTDGTACSDRNPCTEADQCAGGACAGTPRGCDDGNPCTIDACDEASGSCLGTPGPDDRACDDGDRCTRDDRCAAGRCAGTPIACEATAPCRGPGTCDPRTGGCTSPVLPDGTACDDGDGCTQEDRCRGGACSGVLRDCSDDVACTDDVCRDGGCEHLPVDARCDEGDCALAACQPGADGADATGCTRRPVAEGEACTDDGFACTDDRCTAGGCRHLALDDRCTPADACSPMTCAPEVVAADAAGCVPQPSRADGEECAEDGDPCTDDTCAAGGCAHAAVNGKATCDPVRPAYERAVALAVEARSLAAQAVIVVLDGPESEAARAGASAASTFQLVARILAGRVTEEEVLATSSGIVLARSRTVPVGLGETIAQSRARIAFVQVRSTPVQVRVFLDQLALAQRRAALLGPASTDLRRRGRGLLRGAKALKRDLRRLQAVSRTFAR
jgi:hypothetical protein